MSTDNPEAGQDDLYVIICQPYRSYNEIFRALPNSHVARAGCGHLVWVSPQAELFLMSNCETTTTACFTCRPEAPDDNFLLPGARDAVRAHFGDGEAAWLEGEMIRLKIKELPPQW